METFSARDGWIRISAFGLPSSLGLSVFVIHWRVGQMSSPVLTLLEGFSLGLSTGIYCLGSCAPMLVPYVLIESKSVWRSNLGLVGQFLFGRLMAYILFAVLVSLAGSRFSERLPYWAVPAALFLSGALMLLYAAAKHTTYPGLCRWLSHSFPAARAPFALGFLVGINICPPFVAGMTRIIALNDVLLSVLYFVAFFVGTSLYMLPMVLVTPVGNVARLKSIGWLACILSGVWFCLSGLLGLLK